MFYNIFLVRNKRRLIIDQFLCEVSQVQNHSWEVSARCFIELILTIDAHSQRRTFIIKKYTQILGVVFKIISIEYIVSFIYKQVCVVYCFSGICVFISTLVKCNFVSRSLHFSFIQILYKKYNAHLLNFVVGSLNTMEIIDV